MRLQEGAKGHVQKCWYCTGLHEHDIRSITFTNPWVKIAVNGYDDEKISAATICVIFFKSIHNVQMNFYWRFIFKTSWCNPKTICNALLFLSIVYFLYDFPSIEFFLFMQEQSVDFIRKSAFFSHSSWLFYGLWPFDRMCSDSECTDRWDIGAADVQSGGDPLGSNKDPKRRSPGTQTSTRSELPDELVQSNRSLPGYMIGRANIRVQWKE